MTTKTLLGAQPHFVWRPETCQRWPEVTLTAGAVANYLAATAAPHSTGFWDRAPRPTAGRFRRALGRCSFPKSYPLPPATSPKGLGYPPLTGRFPRPHPVRSPTT